MGRETAILIVDHGSRRPEANEQLEQVAELIQSRDPERIVRVAHLEIASPSIAEGVAACVEAGATEIVVHPYLLAPGRHSQEDIPGQATAAAERYPGVTVLVSKPLGLHEKLVDVVLERVAEVEARVEARVEGKAEEEPEEKAEEKPEGKVEGSR